MIVRVNLLLFKKREVVTKVFYTVTEYQNGVLLGIGNKADAGAVTSPFIILADNIRKYRDCLLLEFSK